MKRVELQIVANDHKKRLDDFLFQHFIGLSKMYLREVVKSEKCEVNGRFENVGYKLRADDFVEIELDPSRETAMRPQDIRLDIIYEDEHLIVVNKPAGMLVHPTHRDKSGTLLNALAFYLNREILTQRRRDAESEPGAAATGFLSEPLALAGRFPPQSKIQNHKSKIVRPGLIHRLDKQTSGLIVVAKNATAHRILAGQFMRRLVEKRYLAMVLGVVEANEGTIEAPIGRFAEQKIWDVKPDGKPSFTRFWVRERFNGATLIELEPVTGRTNQLRIHCAAMGHPIIGDVERGGSESDRLCLHAYRLAFSHPEHRERITFESPAPFALSAKFSTPA